MAECAALDPDDLAGEVGRGVGREVDGGAGDLDGIRNGTIVTEWYVNTDDSLGATFLLTAQQVQAGPDGSFGTDDDITTIDELHVEVGVVYHFELESLDVLHGFSIPVFRLKQDAVPGRRITGWFEATRTGTFDIQCAAICGVGHGVMAARIVLETPERHAAWLRERSETLAAAN